MNIIIRRAIPEESAVLTDISFKSKGYWNYPGDYFRVWKDELTITEEYINKNTVYAATADRIIAGYCSVVNNPEDLWAGDVFVNKGYWLEHIFVLPQYIGKGIGTALIKHVKGTSKSKGIEKIFIFADPNSSGFYLKVGAGYLRESPSSIKGRNIPLFELNIL